MFIKILIIALLAFPCIASEIILPKPTGQYSVGTKAIEISDSTRTNLRDKNPKRWMIQAFYPCNKHQETSFYMPGTIQDGIVEGATVKTHSKENATTDNKPSSHIKDDPKLWVLGEKFPVIFFVPGIGSHHQNYTILCEELASHGYVVLAVGEPYVSNFIKFPNGTTIVYRFIDAWKHLWRTDRDYRYQYFDNAMHNTISDITYMIDHLDQIDHALTQTIANNMINIRKTITNDDLGHRIIPPTAYRNNYILDGAKIILMGHSFGGDVAHTLGFKDKRVMAVVNIDSKITERPIFGHVGIAANETNVPVLFIRGMMQYQEDLGDQLTKIANAEIWHPMVQHSAFSDSAFLVAHIPTLANKSSFSQIWAWLLKTGPQFNAVDTSLGNFTVDQWYTEYRNKIVLWLKKHTKN